MDFMKSSIFLKVTEVIDSRTLLATWVCACNTKALAIKSSMSCLWSHSPQRNVPRITRWGRLNIESQVPTLGDPGVNML